MFGSVLPYFATTLKNTFTRTHSGSPVISHSPEFREIPNSPHWNVFSFTHSGYSTFARETSSTGRLQAEYLAKVW
jgi:hypothetical protein